MLNWERYPVIRKLRERLNEATPDATRCAWPGCGRPMQVTIRGQQIQCRVGVLCHDHAVDVAAAVVESQIDVHHLQALLAAQQVDRLESAQRIQADRELDEKVAAEKAAMRKGQAGFIYYIRVDERIKIGYSTDVRRRMKAYPPASRLLAVEPGNRDLERERHRQFAGSLAYGREWFTETVDLREHIDAVVAECGAPPSHMAHHYTTKRQPMRLSRRP